MPARPEEVWLLHLSDLHLGSQVDYLLCQALIDAAKQTAPLLGCPTNDLIVIVSGDLTQDGVDEQFALAYTFLAKQLKFGWGNAVDELGLGVPAPRLQTVAGNHDHWDGSGYRWSRPYNPRLYPSRFRPTPWRETFTSAGGGLEIDLYGLDSNAGLWRTPNYLASGAYRGADLKTLEQMLMHRSSPRGVRVGIVVSHHALFAPLMGLPQPLDDESRERLLDLGARYGIQMILTGHTHTFKYLPTSRSLPFERIITGRPKVIHELRSATSLKGTPAGGGQGFWLHRVWLEFGKPRLQGWRFQWLPTSRNFAPRNQTPDVDIALA